MLMPVSTNNAHGQRIAQTLDDRGRTHTETN
jgi:YD repeat-containing protein